MLSVDQAFNRWHPGEQAVQKLMCLPERASVSAIVNKLPDQHRTFHSTRLHFVPVTTLDDEGRPWASILCSSQGASGFISSPSETALHIHARVWPGDPISKTLHDVGRPLASGLGLEPTTRRRNKFSGRVSHVQFDDNDLTLELSVTHALGLCPKYIQERELVPYPNTAPHVVHDRWHLMEDERLPNDVIKFIHQADTAYLATSYVPPPEDADTHPPRVGTNHRGGRPGFVRVRPGDGRTLVLPNYNGNRMMNSLGNIVVTPLAGIVFPCFVTGSVLYLTGTAQSLFADAAKKLMPTVSALTIIHVTGFALVSDALPIRQRPGTLAMSPYCPPVCYLAEETSPETKQQDVPITLVRTRLHNETLATFTFEADCPVDIQANHNAVLDLSHFVRTRARELGLVDGNSDSDSDVRAWAEHDDCVRTWTVSIPPTWKAPSTFALTIRLVPRGLVTPVLHRVARIADPASSGRTVDMSGMEITGKLRGIGGTLPLPVPIPVCDVGVDRDGTLGEGKRLLWIAGGIGLTPFLGLTRYVTGLAREHCGVWNVVLVVSSREPGVILTLVREAYEGLGAMAAPADDEGVRQGPTKRQDVRPPVNLTFSIHIFTNECVPVLPRMPPSISVMLHDGRIDEHGMFFQSVDARKREPHICGPLPFVNSVMKGLVGAGVGPESVLRERFTY